VLLLKEYTALGCKRTANPRLQALLGGAGCPKMAPFARDHAACVELVRHSFHGIAAGGGLCHTANDPGGPTSQDTCMVYGELTEAGMGKLHDALQLDPDDAVYDLGSGIGKFVLYTALRNECASATGVEVGLKRHVSAQQACANLRQLLSQSAHCGTSCAKVTAQLGDATKPCYSDATVIVLCNIMFGARLNAAIEANILRKSNCRRVAAIVQLRHHRFRKSHVVSCPCTWSRSGVSWTLYDVLPPAEKESWRRDVRVAPAAKWVRPPAGSTIGGPRLLSDGDMSGGEPHPRKPLLACRPSTMGGAGLALSSVASHRLMTGTAPPTRGVAAAMRGVSRGRSTSKRMSLQASGQPLRNWPAPPARHLPEVVLRETTQPTAMVHSTHALCFLHGGGTSTGAPSSSALASKEGGRVEARLASVTWVAPRPRSRAPVLSATVPLGGTSARTYTAVRGLPRFPPPIP